MRRNPTRQLATRALVVAILCGAALASRAPHANAQTPAAAPANFGNLGFPTVAGSGTFTPGTASTVTGGGMTVNLAADFSKDPAKFEMLTGSPAAFAAAAGGRTVILAWAFRVTDTTTNQQIGAFGSPVQWSFTNAAVGSGSIVMNVTAATPPVVTPNGTPPTISGQTIAHPFSGATVAWLVANPPAAVASSSSVSPGTATGLALPRAQAAAQSPVKGPITSQGPASGPATALVAVQAPALSSAPVPVASAPRLPNTGTGGLLGPSKQNRAGAPAEAALVLLGSALLVLALGAQLRRAGRVP